MVRARARITGASAWVGLQETGSIGRAATAGPDQSLRLYPETSARQPAPLSRPPNCDRLDSRASGRLARPASRRVVIGRRASRGPRERKKAITYRKKAGRVPGKAQLDPVSTSSCNILLAERWRSSIMKENSLARAGTQLQFSCVKSATILRCQHRKGRGDARACRSPWSHVNCRQRYRAAGENRQPIAEPPVDGLTSLMCHTTNHQNKGTLVLIVVTKRTSSFTRAAEHMTRQLVERRASQ